MTDPQSVARPLPLVRLQAWSGVTFSLFLLAHLVNQALATLGPARYDAVQGVLRRGYQWAPIELALVTAPLLAHVGAGVALMLRRRRLGVRPPPAPTARLQRWSGLVLLIFFLGHVAATRGASLFFGVFPGFAGVAYTLRWVPAYFWPYYLLFGLSAAYHLLHGLGVALPVVGFGAGRALRRPRWLVPLAALGCVGVAAGVLALGGAWFPVDSPERSAYAQLLMRLGIAHAPTP